MSDETLRIRITADAGDAKKALTDFGQGVNQTVDRAGRSLSRVQSGVRGVGRAGRGLGAAGGGMRGAAMGAGRAAGAVPGIAGMGAGGVAGMAKVGGPAGLLSAIVVDSLDKATQKTQEGLKRLVSETQVYLANKVGNALGFSFDRMEAKSGGRVEALDTVSAIVGQRQREGLETSDDEIKQLLRLIAENGKRGIEGEQRVRDIAVEQTWKDAGLDLGNLMQGRVR